MSLKEQAEPDGVKVKIMGFSLAGGFMLDEMASDITIYGYSLVHSELAKRAYHTLHATVEPVARLRRQFPSKNSLVEVTLTILLVTTFLCARVDSIMS